MVRFPNVKVDPWFRNQEQFKKYKRIPDDAVFICAYLVFMNPIDFGESAFFRCENNIDELWISTWEAEFNEEYTNMELGNKDLFKDFGCAVSDPSTKDNVTASATLLMHLYRSRVGYNFPSKIIRVGMITENQFKDIIQSLKNELDEYARQAKEKVSEVVKTAEELGLHPSPNGQSPQSWRATCPGTSHPIWIDADKDIFGCPWCCRKGGANELREFAEFRRLKKLEREKSK